MNEFIRDRRKTFEEYFMEIFEQLKSNIIRESEKQFIGIDSLELAEYYCQNYILDVLEYDTSRERNWDRIKELKTIPAHRREGFFKNTGDLKDYPCEFIHLEIPIKENNSYKALKDLRSSRFTMSNEEFDLIWTSNLITLDFYIKNYGLTIPEENIPGVLQKKIDFVDQLIKWKNSDIVSENKKLLENVMKLIDERKVGIEKDKEKMRRLTEAINIPLKKVIPEEVQKIILSPKSIVNRIKPNPKLPSEYYLDEHKVNDILEFIDNYLKSLEKTPSSIKTLQEEEIRDLLLANLNSIFKGKATGETFSKYGKADIYLNIDEGKILIFECKIWNGEKIFHETIDQLRGYLTWHHNYGVILIFSRVKNFTKILLEIPEFIQKSVSYKNSNQKINETHFSARHRMEDKDKEVKIHYLFYNLYCDSK